MAATLFISERCYLFPIVETLAKLKQNMSYRYEKIIQRTPFALLIELEPILLERGQLNALLQKYDECTPKLDIGESLLSFRLEDVYLILGLHCDEDEVVFKNKKTLQNLKENIFPKHMKAQRCYQKILGELVQKR